MSRISVIIFACIVLYVLKICSAIKETTFTNERYYRICPANATYGQPTDICRRVAQQEGMFSGDPNIITGVCKEVGVNLEDDDGNPTRISFEIVKCDFGDDNLDACASASSNDGVIEYFQYQPKPNRPTTIRCIHQGSFNL